MISFPPMPTSSGTNIDQFNNIYTTLHDMSGTEQTFHYTKEDVRRMEQKESAANGGNIPKDSPVAAIQVSEIPLLRHYPTMKIY